ncbi:MAG: Rieske 2Fe-2S domain-containing protein [Caulobacterales bacterium]
MVEWTEAAALSDFGAARKLVCDVGGQSVLLCKVGLDIVAIRNSCTHLGEPLADGRIIAGQIHCPFHGACFDLRTGKALSGPAVAPLTKFDVRLDADKIFIKLPG